MPSWCTVVVPTLCAYVARAGAHTHARTHALTDKAACGSMRFVYIYLGALVTIESSSFSYLVTHSNFALWRFPQPFHRVCPDSPHSSSSKRVQLFPHSQRCYLLACTRRAYKASARRNSLDYAGWVQRFSLLTRILFASSSSLYSVFGGTRKSDSGEGGATDCATASFSAYASYTGGIFNYPAPHCCHFLITGRHT